MEQKYHFTVSSNVTPALEFMMEEQILLKSKCKILCKCANFKKNILRGNWNINFIKYKILFLNLIWCLQRVGGDHYTKSWHFTFLCTIYASKVQSVSCNHIFLKFEIESPSNAKQSWYFQAPLLRFMMPSTLTWFSYCPIKLW